MLYLCPLALVAAALVTPPNFWDGKRVLLTGASSGLGASLAKELSGRGAL